LFVVKFILKIEPEFVRTFSQETSPSLTKLTTYRKITMRPFLSLRLAFSLFTVIFSVVCLLNTSASAQTDRDWQYFPDAGNGIRK
jgi:hypothetical protein